MKNPLLSLSRIARHWRRTSKSANSRRDARWGLFPPESLITPSSTFQFGGRVWSVGAVSPNRQPVRSLPLKRETNPSLASSALSSWDRACVNPMLPTPARSHAARGTVIQRIAFVPFRSSVVQFWGRPVLPLWNLPDRKHPAHWADRDAH